jgi:long-subunit acyl-CoA synthetase (AMP-forming)
MRAEPPVLDALTVEDGSLTPTRKVKRIVIADRYHAEIEKFYAKRAARRAAEGQ